MVQKIMEAHLVSGTLNPGNEGGNYHRTEFPLVGLHDQTDFSPV